MNFTKSGAAAHLADLDRQIKSEEDHLAFIGRQVAQVESNLESLQKAKSDLVALMSSLPDDADIKPVNAEVKL